jgi:hypothetical protein
MPDSEGSLKIHQDVKAYNALLAAGESVSYARRKAPRMVANGQGRNQA